METSFRITLLVKGMVDNSQNLEVGNRLEFNDNRSAWSTVPIVVIHTRVSNRALQYATSIFGARRGSRSNCTSHKSAQEVIAG